MSNEPKAIRLTPKEISRSDSGYTVIVRPQERSGGWLVAAVRIEGSVGFLMGKPYTRFVETKSDVHDAVKDVTRWLDKMGFPGQMGGASRDRVVARYKKSVGR